MGYAGRKLINLGADESASSDAIHFNGGRVII